MAKIKTVSNDEIQILGNIISYYELEVLKFSHYSPQGKMFLQELEEEVDILLAPFTNISELDEVPFLKLSFLLDIACLLYDIEHNDHTYNVSFAPGFVDKFSSIRFQESTNPTKILAELDEYKDHQITQIELLIKATEIGHSKAAIETKKFKWQQASDSPSGSYADAIRKENNSTIGISL